MYFYLDTVHYPHNRHCNTGSAFGMVVREISFTLFYNMKRKIFEKLLYCVTLTPSARIEYE